MRKLGLCAVLLLLSSAAYPQAVQVNKENKTIAITAEDEVSVDADMAIVSIGYDNYALTEHEAYDNNLKTAARILQALIKSGVKEGVIHTDKLRVESVDTDKDWSTEEKRQRKFSAHQSWEITLPATEAQKAVD